LKMAVVAFVVPSVTVLALARPLLGMMARDEYVAAATVMPLLAVAFLLIIVAYPAHSLLTLHDRVKTLAVIELLGMACGLIGNLVLIPRYSYFGAAGASVLGFAVTLVLKWLVSGMSGTLRMDVLFSVRDEWQAVRRSVRQFRGVPAMAMDNALRFWSGGRNR
jgi:O-antigen/teichoic acid export membrane protein